jgi:hypothetical protein
MQRHRALRLALIVIACVARVSSSAAQSCCHSAAKETPNVIAGDSVAAPMRAVNTSTMRKEFNASSDKVRIVALLSPTCPDCQSGHAVVGRVLRKFSSSELQTILVWEPMREGDSPVAATREADTLRDARITQGWDGSKNIGGLFGQTLGLHAVAWDVYLVYKQGIKWEGTQPPPPTFWMHQLQGADPNLLLCANPTELTAEVGKLLRQPD